MEPVTLAVVGSLALTEGVKFLFNQAGELLKDWRAKRKAAGEEGGEALADTSVDIKLPEVAFENQLSAPKIHYDALEKLESDIAAVYDGLLEYQNQDEMNPKDETLAAKADALRQLLEVVLRQRIIFKGEDRPRETSGPAVNVEMEIGRVTGLVTGLRAKRMLSGTADVKMKTGPIDKGANVTGAEFDEFGS